MTEPASPAAVPEEPALDPRIAWDFCRFSGGFWTGHAWTGRTTIEPWKLLAGLGLVLVFLVTIAAIAIWIGWHAIVVMSAAALVAVLALTRGSSTRRAWLLTIGLGLFLAASTAATVALNHWNRWFFDALERKDVAAVWQLVGWIAGIVFVMAAIGVGIVLTRETLQVRWRAWLIDRLLERWLGERRFYHMNARRIEPANPEYRIADDTRWATEPLTDLGIGLVIAVFNAVAFISILWSVGGSYTIGGVVIPAYMVIVAIAYGVLMSLIMMWIGKPLPGFVYRKNEREGDFRFALMRLRENAESIALLSGHRFEHQRLSGLFDQAVAAWMLIVRRHGYVTWVTNSSGPLIPIVPLLFAAPKYLSGDLTLGQVTQLAGAFLAVQGAISWIVDNFNRISEWYASARRVMDIVEACDEVDGHALRADASAIRYIEADGGKLRLEKVGVRDPFGGPLLGGIDLEIAPGETVHILGDTSIGKTTLVRALSGLWTRGEGAVHLPSADRTRDPLIIVPQKPYLPLGTLREILTYPNLDATAGTALSAETALEQVGLGSLKSELDQAVRWDHRLSSGERQRLAIARVLLAAPQVLVLDDALSALDEASQSALLKTLKTRLQATIIVSLGQATPPAGSVDRIVTLNRTAGVATLRPAPVPA